MEAADWIIDLGPGAGIHGGKIVYEGEYNKILKDSIPDGTKYLPFCCGLN